MSFQWLKQYGITLIVFLGVDSIWLLLIAKNLYAKYLGYIMAKNPNLLAALAFYLIFIAGVMYFVLTPALVSGEWRKALLSGLLFGFVTYATYDLTNLATIKAWPILITVIDLLWGSFVTGLTAVLSFFAIHQWL